MEDFGAGPPPGVSYEEWEEVMLARALEMSMQQSVTTLNVTIASPLSHRLAIFSSLFARFGGIDRLLFLTPVKICVL